MKTDSETAHIGCIEEIEVKKRSYTSTPYDHKGREKNEDEKAEPETQHFKKTQTGHLEIKSTVSKIKVFGVELTEDSSV